MSELAVTLQRSEIPNEAEDFLAVVEANDGRRFRLGILKPVLEVWKQQIGDLDIDELASRLAKDLLEQDPSSSELDEGFLVTLDNGFATPTAAERNIENSGVMPFLAHKYKGNNPTGADPENGDIS